MECFTRSKALQNMGDNLGDYLKIIWVRHYPIHIENTNLLRRCYMSLTIAVHSSKGGTGKTSIAINLAGAYLSAGKSVCIMDMDSKGPSMHTFFDLDPECYINDYVLGNCSTEEMMHKIDTIDTSGELYVGFSDPDIASIREFSTMDRKWQTRILKRMIDAKKDLYSAGIDVVILDTSPGVEFGSVNAVAVSDFVLITIKPNMICFNSIEQVINGIYLMLDKKCAIVENMCPADHFSRVISSDLFDIPVMESISCMCDVACRTDDEILTINDPQHPYSKSVFKIAEKIEKYIED